MRRSSPHKRVKNPLCYCDSNSRATKLSLWTPWNEKFQALPAWSEQWGARCLWASFQPSSKPKKHESSSAFPIIFLSWRICFQTMDNTERASVPPCPAPNTSEVLYQYRSCCLKMATTLGNLPTWVPLFHSPVACCRSSIVTLDWPVIFPSRRNQT